jgi:hypothetical protein
VPHFIPIIGYDGTGVWLNDPGISWGRGCHISYAQLAHAIDSLDQHHNALNQGCCSSRRRLRSGRGTWTWAKPGGAAPPGHRKRCPTSPQGGEVNKCPTSAQGGEVNECPTSPQGGEVNKCPASHKGEVNRPRL